MPSHIHHRSTLSFEMNLELLSAFTGLTEYNSTQFRYFKNLLKSIKSILAQTETFRFYQYKTDVIYDDEDSFWMIPESCQFLGLY